MKSPSIHGAASWSGQNDLETKVFLKQNLDHEWGYPARRPIVDPDPQMRNEMAAVRAV